MSPELIMLALVVVTALAFDFTNGFHDTANAMAASIATKALTPKVAVVLCASLNLVGALLSVEVALTVTNAVIRVQNPDGTPRADLVADGGSKLLLILLAGLAGAIIWNLSTWLWGLPSSSSHALFGGLIGATVAGIGWSGVKWVGDGNAVDGVLGKVIIPAFISPAIAMAVGLVGTNMVFRVAARLTDKYRSTGFRWGQVGAASLMSLSHGTNDAQKTMGVITLALIATGVWTNPHEVPLWVKLSCALTIALGTYLGGWRIIRTMGKGLVEIEPPQGMSADMSSASVILASSQLGFALSTTQVATGSILGSGVGRGALVRWRVAGRMASAWLTTLPAAAVVGALMYVIGAVIGGNVGAVVVFLLLCTAAFLIWLRSRKQPIGHHNVNDEWTSEKGKPKQEMTV
ncbi:MAG TPA: inorganic phosphate transporter [Micropruina sp.]|nr:inorganic phosphate transporter [Micropruina sp.]